MSRFFSRFFRRKKKEEPLKEEPAVVEEERDPADLDVICEEYGRPDLSEPLSRTLPLNPRLLCKSEGDMSGYIGHVHSGFLVLYDKGLYDKDLRKEEKLEGSVKEFNKAMKLLKPESRAASYLTMIIESPEDVYNIALAKWKRTGQYDILEEK